MSKLDEVIRSLENLSFPFENSDWSIIEDCTESLIELNKPVQYTVEIQKHGNNFNTWYRFKINKIDGNATFYTQEEAKIAAFAMLNKSAKTLSLPPITIEQITFVEV